MSQTPLLLLPGSLCDARLWRHQLINLADVAAVGVGDIDRDDTIEGMARSILAHAPDRFALAGLSLGGIVALEIVHQAPERVLRLALLDTNPGPPTEHQRRDWREFAGMAAEGRLRELVEQRLLPSLLHPDRRRDSTLVADVVAMADTVGATAYDRQLRAQMRRRDRRGDLARIVCPTLVLVGRQDALCPVEMHEAMAAGVPGSVLVIIEQCGHLSSLDQPEAVTAALRRWLQLPAAAPPQRQERDRTGPVST